MNRVNGILLGCVAVACMAAADTLVPPTAWQGTHDVGPLASGDSGALRIPVTGPDPFITAPPLGVTTTNDLVVELRLRSSEGGRGQLFWFRDGAREEASAHFDVGTNVWTDVCLSVPGAAEGWRWRLDPPGIRGFAELAWFRVAQAGARGITEVSATATELELRHGPTTAGAFDVIELRPHEGMTAVPRGVASGVASPGGTLRIPRLVTEDGRERDRLTSGFLLRERTAAGDFRPVGAVRHLQRFDGPALLPTPPVVAHGKKGLQVQMVDDALTLGIHHAALNVNLPSLLAPADAADTYPWRSNGREFRFRRSAIDAIPVKPLSDAGVSVSLILLAYASGDAAVDRLWLHPDYSSKAPNRLGAFNTSSAEGVGAYQATVEFLAHHFSQPDARHGRVSHFIVGNEVTAHWHWANMGDVPADVFIRDYVRVVRLTHAAVRGVTRAVRVCLSLDHHWNLTYGNQPTRAIAGRRLIDEFNRVARMGGNFEWHLAYHPYPEDLFKARTWKDRTALPGPDTPRITFRNLGVITDYMRRPELLFEGVPRRVLLTEQGFHSDGTEAGEALQAAAYAYAWRKVMADPGIDCFILHRHVDHRHEGGLNLGLWRRKPESVADPLSPKPIHEVFRRAGTPQWEEAFRFALPIIGVTNWSEVAP
jgi:Family of unknown function (DUF5722)